MIYVLSLSILIFFKIYEHIKFKLFLKNSYFIIIYFFNNILGIFISRRVYNIFVENK